MSDKNKICFIVSRLSTARAFLDNHIHQLSKIFDVYIVANLTEMDYEYLLTLPIKSYMNIKIEREINLYTDLKSVFALSRYFKSEIFFAVHSVTPKAGLITAIAGKIAGTENRIHIFTGQVWASRKGMIKHLLKFMDKLIAKLNTHILVDGNAQREFLINENIVTEKKSIVLAHGSIAGVDIANFKPNKQYRSVTRNLIGVSDNQVVYLFLGRICKDKGIEELLDAFSNLHKKYRNAYLLLIGRDEEGYIENIKVKYKNLVEKENFYHYGFVPSPIPYFNASDVFCLPSYREGFGMSTIEASSTGLPIIVSDAYGLRDAIVPEVTGLVCKVQDVDSLYSQMLILMEQPELRKLFSTNGRKYIKENFTQVDVTKAWIDFYKSL